MSSSISNEFFYFDKSLDSGHHDFTGNPLVTTKQRKDFLKNYAYYLERIYDLPEKPQYAVPLQNVYEDLEKMTAVISNPTVSKCICFNKMNASLQHLTSDYEGWSLYTKKASVKKNTLIFSGNDLPPTPAAVYSFDGTKRVKTFSFTVCIDKGYSSTISGGASLTTSAKTVELRSGINDIVKLHFYSNGEFYVRLGNECPYHLKNVLIGNFTFDEPQEVTVKLKEETFSVVFNGTESEDFPLASMLNPDMIFVGSGMFHIGKWEFTPKSLGFEDYEINSFFNKVLKNSQKPIFVGEVELPYQIGTFKNRDMAIILEKSFTVGEFKKAILQLNSLDPGGLVWVNGINIASTDSFESIKVDISEHLIVGENTLKILVFPRAPEVLFNWHRQKDPYNGWFCEEINLTLFNEIEIDNLKVITNQIEESKVNCRITANLTGDLTNCRVRLLLRKIYPEVETNASCLGEFNSDKNFSTTVSFEAELWTPDTPNLYEVRLIVIDENGNSIDDATVETGFRIIEQKNGDILLNGKKIILTGALLMQFLPPYSETSATHICPKTYEVLWQEMMVKKMNGNTMRIHILGYGTNDVRYARIADRLGLMLIWTTRYIDSVEQLALQPDWAAKDGYIRQIEDRFNHPSIIMWEGSNEYHPSLKDIDIIYEKFVTAVKEVDNTRIICPVSHLYYAGDSYPIPNCAYYNDDGTTDHNGSPVKANPYWCDSSVIRSAHTYSILLGYGTNWERLRKQAWSMQKELTESKNHAYIVSEFAVIGRQNPTTPEAMEYFNEYSYEFRDEINSGLVFSKDEWKTSQAYQALAAKVAVQIMRLNNIDGMLWCCLMGGANDAGYLKPPIDCYGYPKLAFYTLREGYQELYVSTDNVDIIKGSGFEIAPVIYGTKTGNVYTLCVSIVNMDGNEISKKVYEGVTSNGSSLKLPLWKPEISENGYYGLRFNLQGNN